MDILVLDAPLLLEELFSVLALWLPPPLVSWSVRAMSLDIDRGGDGSGSSLVYWLRPFVFF
jgi:hypothetical protein